MNIREIPTPALVLDCEAFEYNLTKMAEITNDAGVALRPHYKSHKCPEIAKMQIKLGAVGVCCAKLSEAIDLAENGVDNIFIANQIVDPEKIKELARLAGRCRLTVCADDHTNLLSIERALEEERTFADIYIELDAGMHRCGTDVEGAVALAVAVRDECPRLRFTGIQAYCGHISHEYDDEVRRNEVKSACDTVRILQARLLDEGFDTAMLKISGISTGTLLDKLPYGVYNEVQVGSYIFQDTSYGKMELPFRSSLNILATVISVKPDRAVTDVGVKACAVDQLMPVALGFEDSELALHEEHGIIYRKDHGLALNDRVRIKPGHCCATVNLYRKIYLVKGDEVVGELEVVSHGKSQ